jgi:hypothetical protein
VGKAGPPGGKKPALPRVQKLDAIREKIAVSKKISCFGKTTEKGLIFWQFTQSIM